MNDLVPGRKSVIEFKISTNYVIDGKNSMESLYYQESLKEGIHCPSLYISLERM